MAFPWKAQNPVCLAAVPKMPQVVMPMASPTAMQPSGISSIAPRVEIGLAQLSGDLSDLETPGESVLLSEARQRQPRQDLLRRLSDIQHYLAGTLR